jgi:aryl sulfotransferase
MIFPGPDRPAVSDVSPWVDRWRNDRDLATMINLLDGQTHRRMLKSHLSLDAIPYHPGTRYIVVVRDARDVFMSLWNHLSMMNDAVIDVINALPGRVGDPMPRVGSDIHAFWANWINRGWFSWESEGYPHSGNMAHTQSWWTYRHLPNILFVHFSDLLADPGGEVRRVAAHLNIGLSDAAVQSIVAETSFREMRANAVKAGPMPEAGAAMTWPEGLLTFFHKGTNGRWRDVLSVGELEMYHVAKARAMTPDCAAFTEKGRAWAAEADDGIGSAKAVAVGR